MKMPRSFRSGRLLGFPVLAALLFLGSVAAAGAPEKTRLVVVLYPEGNAAPPGEILVDRGIRATFANGSRESVEIHSEHLDVSRFNQPTYQQHLAEFLRRKYAGRQIDVLIVGLASALDFALKYRDQAFPGVPIIFCAVDGREVKARKLPPDVIGVPVQMDLATTLNLALELHPATERVFVVTGKAGFDVEWEDEARQTFRAFEDRLELRYLSGLPLPELLERVAQLPERSIIYYLHVFQDGSGKILIPAEVLKLVAARANVPVYGHVDTYVGRGIIGGRVFSFENAGKDAATLGLRILAGEKPEKIGIQEVAANTYMFDARQLRRWGISESRLPAGSVVHHHEPGFWDLYRWHIVGLLSICVVETLLIAGLLVQRSSRVRAERRFRQVVEAAPNGMVMVAQDGTIVLANALTAKLFGYAKEEMLGQRVEMLLPERFRPEHPADRAGFFAAPEIRLMGAGRELLARRKDGSEFPVEIGLSPVRTDAGLFVLASIMDITQRKEAEECLGENQRELRELTGRLLQAQEMERRRIAGELHDDLNQSLALLAVELDLLGQKPPGLAAQFGQRVKELSAQVKRLSSWVHDLSHQLHPAKLEQLGLLATVRSLCTELAQNHGLAISFNHDQVPQAIPESTALCLYRIAQEALQNVIKHSGAHNAEVQLRGSAEAISLRISDDGAGFNPGQVDGNGSLGLISMRERLRLVNGDMTIDSRSGAGTRIDVRVPLPTSGQVNVLLPQPARIG